MKKYLIYISSIILIVFITACSSDKASDRSVNSSKKMDEITITEAFHSLLYLPLYVGMDEDIFKNNGIDITTLRSAGTGPTAMTSVLSGESEFSIHGPEHVVFSKVKGGHAKIASSIANSGAIWMLANKQVQIDSINDLKGKKIVVALAPGTSHTLLSKLLEENDIDIKKDVFVTEVQLGSELGPVLAGKADIAVAYQPQADQGVAEGLKIIHEFTKDYPEFAFSTINTSQKVINDNPDMVKRFIKAMDESLDLVHENPEKATEIAIKEFPELDKEVVTRAVQRMIDSKVFPDQAELSENAFKEAMTIQKYVGNLKEDVDYNDVYFTP